MNQITLEQSQYYRGMELYMDRAEDQADRKMVKEMTSIASAALSTRIDNEPRKDFVKLLKNTGLTTDVLAHVGLTTLVSLFRGNELTLVEAASKVGTSIYNVVRNEQFKAEHADVWDRLESRRASDEDFDLVHDFNIGVEQNEVINVGVALVHAACATGYFEHDQVRDVMGDKHNVVRVSELGMAHIADLTIPTPVSGPLIESPLVWSNLFDGGYHTPTMRENFPLMRLKGSAHRRHMRGKKMERVLAFVNKVQSQEWVVNTEVLNVLKHFENTETPALPSTKRIQITGRGEERQALIDSENSRRGKRLTLNGAIAQAEEYSQFDKIWFTPFLDSRGRVYFNSYGITPQGADFQKALILPYEAKPVGKGSNWFKVHLANCAGVDKVSFTDRIQWTDDNAAMIIGCGTDPLVNTEWMEQDAPWMFLAAAIEFAKWAKTGYSTEFKTRQIIALDGTCSGLQHLSAILRDEVGGAAVNLTNGDKPSDIYGLVAGDVIELLKVSDDEHAPFLLSLGINRKTTKRQVMTLAYGATTYSCLKYTIEWMNSLGVELPAGSASLLSRTIWAAMGKRLGKAMGAMKWMQGVASHCSKNDQAVQWTTSFGFEAFQRNNTKIVQQFKTSALGEFSNTKNGRIDISIGTFTNDIDAAKQRNSIAPNVVHSYDAAHLMTTVEKLTEKLDSFHAVLVHDSFGSHLCDGDELALSVREAFVEVHSTDVLGNLALSNGMEEYVLPESGELSLESIMESSYIFC